MSQGLEIRRPPGDPGLTVLAVLLSLVGVAMIYSAGQVEVSSVAVGIWQRQLLWLGVSLAAFALVVRVPMRWVEWAAPWSYALSLGLLLLVLIVGTGPNTRSWLDLGFGRLQPAEMAKLATVLLLARTLSGRRTGDRLVHLWKPLLIVLAPLVLVMAQPDLGSALVFGVILISALFWAGVPLLMLLLLISPGVSLILGFSVWIWGGWFLILTALLWYGRPYVGEGIAVLAANVTAGAMTLPIWNSLAPYQQNRLLVFLDPGLDPRGSGWHLIQSRVAIGSGGWLGQGYLEGPQKRLAFLPEQHTDFIFSVLGEEFGFVGVVVVLSLFGVFLWRVLSVARASENDFGSQVAFCLFGIWFAHLLVNVGMTVGLMPITGLPLPFLSYGGSFLLAVYVGLGLVGRVAEER